MYTLHKATPSAMLQAQLSALCAVAKHCALILRRAVRRVCTCALPGQRVLARTRTPAVGPQVRLRPSPALAPMIAWTRVPAEVRLGLARILASLAPPPFGCVRRTEALRPVIGGLRVGDWLARGLGHDAPVACSASCGVPG